MNPPELDNPGSCAAGDALTMEREVYLAQDCALVRGPDGQRLGHIRRGADENLALQLVMQNAIEIIKCITPSSREYYDSAILGFTIEVEMRGGHDFSALITAKGAEDCDREEKSKTGKSQKATKSSSKHAKKNTPSKRSGF